MTLNREELRKAAASRRNDAAAVERVTVWHCDHCLRDYATETGFMNHHCPEFEKLELLRSPQGQAAYSYYADWMRANKRSVPPQETFLNSKQFNYFVKFAGWVDKTAVPNVKRFVELMVETDTPPMLWCRDTTYALYLEWFDNAFPPEQQFVETLDFMRKLSIDHEVEPKQLYTHLGAFEIAKYVRHRKISPWLLVVAPGFLNWVSKLPQHERDVLNEAINFMAYANKIRANPELAALLRKACEQEAL